MAQPRLAEAGHWLGLEAWWERREFVQPHPLLKWRRDLPLQHGLARSTRQDATGGYEARGAHEPAAIEDVSSDLLRGYPAWSRRAGSRDRTTVIADGERSV